MNNNSCMNQNMRGQRMMRGEMRSGCRQSMRSGMQSNCEQNMRSGMQNGCGQNMRSGMQNGCERNMQSGMQSECERNMCSSMQPGCERNMQSGLQSGCEQSMRCEMRQEQERNMRSEMRQEPERHMRTEARQERSSCDSARESCERRESREAEIPTGSRKALLCFINEVSFAVYEALLYLDTHPTDQEAMQFFREHNQLRNRALREFNRLYGPLTIETANDEESKCWEWMNQPWPWEGGDC